MSIGDKLLDFRDDVGVKMIMRASEKMKSMNAQLEKEGADARVKSFEFQPGMPPSMTFCIEVIPEDSNQTLIKN